VFILANHSSDVGSLFWHFQNWFKETGAHSSNWKTIKDC
jgi:hypothetical protein